MEVSQNGTVMKQGDAHPYQGKKGGAEGSKARMGEKEVIGRFHPVVKGHGGGECRRERRKLNGGEDVFVEKPILFQGLQMMDKELEGGRGGGRG